MPRAVPEQREVDKSLVVSVRCCDYAHHTVASAVQRCFRLLGGPGPVIHKGDRVLIKPNLLAAKRPEQATTTHPEVVAAVVQEVIRAGGKPMIGDSPGAVRRCLEEVWEVTGMREVSEQTGAPLVNLEAGGSYRRSKGGQDYYICKVAMDADVIVNLPKLKTHSLVLFTGAIKNMFGLVPGLRKKEAHLIHPRPLPFSAALVDLFSFVMPQITLMDAVEGMEGDGPAAGLKRRVGLLLAGYDAVAVDAVAALAVGLNPLEIHTCAIAAQRNLGHCSLDHIQLVGERLERIVVEKFAHPRTDLTGLIPAPLARFAKKFVYIHPRILAEICTNCNTCVESCPTGALRKGSVHPHFRPRKCIGCFCCHELCPESAIKLKPSLIARWIP